MRSIACGAACSAAVASLTTVAACDAPADPPVDAPPEVVRLVLDPSFGSGGLATAGEGLPGSSDLVGAIAAQADGKLIVVGTTVHTPDPGSQLAGQIVVARLTPMGALDPTFGSAGTGFTLVPIGARANGYAVGIQSDGHLIVGGDAWFSASNQVPVVARLTPDGVVDGSFGTDGVLELAPSGRVYSIMVDSLDRIVAVGRVDQDVPKFLVARLTADGVPDADFAEAGIAAIAIGESAIGHTVARGPGNTIVALGETGLLFGYPERIAVLRLLDDGALDASFGGGDGMFISNVAMREEASGLGVDAVHRIIVGGITVLGPANATGVLMRLTPDGELDTSFGGGDGLVTNTLAYFRDIAPTPAGIVVAVTTPIAHVWRYLEDGTFDSSFNMGTGGNRTDVELAYDGKRVYLASTDAVVDHSFIVAARILPDGGPDQTYGTSGSAIIESGATQELGTHVVVDPDGVFAVGRGHVGGPRAVLAKLLPSGVPDPAFGQGGALRIEEFWFRSACGVHRTNGGDLVIAGHSADGIDNDFVLARYTSSGTLDTTFADSGFLREDVQEGSEAWPRAMAVDSAGNYIVVGSVGDSQELGEAGIIRVTSAGMLDVSFDGDGRQVLDLGTTTDSLVAVDIGPRDTIIAVTDGATTIRLDANGDLDPSFDADGIASPSLPGVRANAVRVQGDGKVVIAGYQLEPPALVVARLTADGALDVAFGSDGIVTHAIGDAGTSLVQLGQRFGGPAVMVDGNHIRVAATTTTGRDESIIVVSLAENNGAMTDVATAAGPSYWSGLAIAPAPGGGVIVAGRGYSPTGGTEIGVARFVPGP